MPTPAWDSADPMVSVTITEPDQLTVSLFGVPYQPPPEWEPLTRGSFGRLMDHLYEHLGRPFTVEVIETDGSRQTGVINLPAPPAGPDPAAWPEASSPVPRRMLPEPDEPGPPGGGPARGQPQVMTAGPEHAAGGIEAAGFRPGEPVTVAVILGTVAASPGGTTPAISSGWLKAGLLLAGSESGHIWMTPREAGRP